MNKVVLYCRPGFEKECAAEITDKAAKREVFGFARVKENAGYVVFECYQAEDADKLARELPFSSLIFARQMFVAGELLKDLPAGRPHHAYCWHAAGRGGEGRRSAR
ncbi:ribosomal RNA large subunit methyltransferase M [Enterobacter asburiae]|uniref:Ribosomal RNA large subunit methyltransferase M n=1 Tax=Enterobacter asburiae TaxID=61645 RepID=A0A376FEG9_ENTAS|nr:ribosomal RNA large subunit methyltransferase M [Enterobacter asburiae]